MPRYYAKQSPRGFANEVNVYAFKTRALRDAWVAEHEDDGDVNAATMGARAITADHAKRILAQTGDAATEMHNALIDA